MGPMGFIYKWVRNLELLEKIYLILWVILKNLLKKEKKKKRFT